MSFNSLPYLAFFAVVLAVYFALQTGGKDGVPLWRTQNAVLLVASYVFYAWFDLRFAGLLALMTLLNHGIGGRIAAAGDRARWRWLAASVLVNLGVLGFFKYAGFFAANATALLAVFGMRANWAVTHVALPVGISFYTFQALGYCIDIHRRRMAPARSLPEFALFLAFFPQLVLGPIERAARLLPQFRAPRPIDTARFLSGGWLAFLGFFKKIAVADALAPLCDPLFAVRDTYAGWDVALGAFLFSVQIYADFSGYADIARGTARMLGFDVVRNFERPYFARNLQDFWNRWHISLTAWIRDYVYFPLALHRGARRLGAGGLAIVAMGLMGLWHGADWAFVVWGLYHGALLALYGALRPTLHRLTPAGPARATLFVCAGGLVTFVLVALGEVLFRTGLNSHHAGADSSALGQGLTMLRDLLVRSEASATTVTTFAAALPVFAPLLLLDAYAAWKGGDDAVLAWPALPRRLLQASMLFCILHALADRSIALGTPFQYFRF